MASEPHDPDSDPSNPKCLTFNDVKEAAQRIEGGIIHTPLCEAKLSKFTDYDIYLKCENLQYTGSALERGIRNALMKRLDLFKNKGAIVGAGGNAALAAAYHGGVLGVKVTVVMPETTTMMKVQRCKDLDAEVILHGRTIDLVQKYAIKHGKASGKVYLNTSDQIDAMAGQATTGLEIISQLPETDAVIVPVDSGGLLAGILIACKKLKCSCLVYGAESARVPKFMKTLQAGKRVSVPVVPTMADSLASGVAGPNSVETVQGKLDRMLVVDEVWIARAVLSIMEREKLVVEGGGACAVAAVMQGLVPELRGKKVVCVLSAGNIDSCTLVRVIQRGMAASGRLIKISAVLPDSPSAMADLMQILACGGAVVKSVITEQIWVKKDIGSMTVKVVAETLSEEHCESMKGRLRMKFPQVFITTVADLA